MGLQDHARAVATGETTAAALVTEALRRIEDAQPRLNAFRCVRADAALAEAEEADRRIAAGERLPLLGVPVAVKDDTDVAGEITAFGCDGTFAASAEDAEVVRRLRAAGAIIVGKTNTPEFGQWPFTEGPGFGATRNPWSTEHTPGGSSGGAAAAVAAGLVDGAIGSDGAGSVRIPAAWTGLVGIKPQRGRISTWPHPEAFNGLTVLGPLARTVADAALLLDVCSGGHPGDRHTPPPPDEPFAAAAERADPGTLRVALSTRIPFSGPPARLHPEVRAAIERLAQTIAGLGHDVDERDPRYGLVGLSFVPRASAGVREWATRMPDARLDRRTRETARNGAVLGGPLLALPRAAERPLQAQLGAVFRDADVVLAPTTATPPPRIGRIDGLSSWETDKAMIAACPYAWPWNVVGFPSVNVPAGLTADGLPLGAQLIGPPNSEARLLALAAQLEAVERWHERRPPEFAATEPDQAPDREPQPG